MNLKDVRKLQERTYREETGLFFVEGRKNILELIHSSFSLHTIFTTAEALPEFRRSVEERGITPTIIVVTPEALERAGTLTTNGEGIALGYIQHETKDLTEIILQVSQKELVLVLDDVNDPGNLGTIIRTADWFGVTTLLVSPNTVDAYNPKVLRSTMGSFTRVRVYRTELYPLLTTLRTEHVPIYGAVLNGTPLTPQSVPHAQGVIVLGSESHGIHPDIEGLLTHPLTIPGRGRAESLNVGVAAGIILALCTCST